MKTTKLSQYTYNRLLGYKREAAGKDKNNKQLYKWVKKSADIKNGTISFNTKLPSGTLINAEYKITSTLNIGELVRKEILKPDKTEIVGQGNNKSVTIKKGNVVRTTYQNLTEKNLPKLLRYLELNVVDSIVNLKKFRSLLKLK